jgi:hypothetical protein
MERQKHGFLFEAKIISMYNLIKTEEYTSVFDAYTKCNIPVQIKYIKYDSPIDMGDFYRKLTINTSFILIIGRWLKCKKTIYNIKCHYVDISTFKKNIQVIDLSLLSKAKNEMKSISNCYSDDIKWKKLMKYYKPLISSNILIPRFKRDHKCQKRIQCAIPNKTYKTLFCKLFPPKKSLEELILNKLNKTQ